jgi:hypothetical protein
MPNRRRPKRAGLDVVDCILAMVETLEELGVSGTMAEFVTSRQ